MFESLERENRSLETQPEGMDELCDGRAKMGNALSETLGEIERIERDPTSSTGLAERKKLGGLRLKKLLLERGLDLLKRIQEQGTTALDL